MFRSSFAALLAAATVSVSAFAQDEEPDASPEPSPAKETAAPVVGTVVESIDDPLYATKPDLLEKPIADLVKQVGSAIVTVKGTKGLGSGFIIHPDGFLVTNAHVVEGENTGNLTVSVYKDTDHGIEQTDYPKIRIVAYNGLNDLAVLKIEPKEPVKFNFVNIGDSTALRQSSKVFTFGSPMGLVRSISEGIVAVKNRGLEQGFFIQTTAPISPGNSGGPLLNMKGEVIGVNSMKAVGGGAEGLGFAIPSDFVKMFLRNREAFMFDPGNPANGLRYLAPPEPLAGGLLKDGRKPIRLAAPKLMAVKDKVSLLRSGDIDGDKRLDLIAANNDAASIEIFYQRTPEELRKLAAEPAYSDREVPVLDNAPFFEDSIIVADDIYDLVPVDFDGDGLMDIAYCGRRTGVNVVFQTAPGKWEKTSRYDKYSLYPHDGTLRVADMDGDGKPDLVVIALGGRALIFKGGQGQRDLGLPVVAGVANQDAQTIQVADVNGDKRPDLLFIASGQKGGRNLSIRLQDPHGGFGPEFPITLDVGNPAWLPFGKDAASFATIGEKTQEVRTLRLADRVPGKDDREELQPQILRPPVSETAGLLSALADLSGAKRPDVVVADAEGAALYVYSSTADGRLGEGTAYPSLRAVTSLSRLRFPGDAADSVLVCSATEKIAGVAAFKDGRLGFPTPLPLTTEPFFAESVHLGKDPAPAVVCATRDGQRFNLETLTYDAALKQWKSKITKLGTLARDPSGLLVRDVNGDGLDDLLVFFPREAARIIVQGADGTFHEACADDSVRKSQLDGVTPEMVGFGDFGGDGKTKILVARTGFIRAYSLTGDKNLTLVDQANARSATDVLTTPALVDLDGKGGSDLIAYDAANKSLQVLTKQNGLYRYQRSIFAGKNEPQRILASDTSEGRGLLIAGARQVWNLPLSGKQWLVEDPTAARSKVKNARFYEFAAGDLNHDGTPDLVAIDGANHGIEIFSADGKGVLASTASFRVYSDERKQGGGGDDNKRVDPRSISCGDFDNDGLCDLAVLCRDRLLLYKQDK